MTGEPTVTPAAGPADRHRRIAATFTARVRGTQDWQVPVPVAGWTARDVVGHLVGWLPAFLQAGAGVTVDAGPGVDVDPVAAWTVHTDAVQRLLDDPATSGRRLVNPHVGELPLDVAIDRLYTPDVFLHTWDLARATGQDDRIDEELCAQLLAGMVPLDEQLRASGHYGPRVAVPDGTDARTQLIGFIGRDPFWTPPTG